MTQERPRLTTRLRAIWPWAIMVLGAPLAAFGLLLSPNDYAPWDVAGVDCDGPTLLVFAIPAIAVYLMGAVVFSKRAARGTSQVSAVAAVLCAMLVVALGANSLAAVEELGRPDHQASCT